MSKETTAKGMDLIRKKISEEHQTMLRQIDVLGDNGLFVLEVEEGMKRIADTEPDPNKVTVLGTVYATFGDSPVKTAVTLFLNQQGSVFASSDIKTQTGFKRLLPVFKDKEHAKAWKAFRELLPEYLQAIGVM